MLLLLVLPNNDNNKLICFNKSIKQVLVSKIYSQINKSCRTLF
jgi:hypothetical protein